MMIRKLEPAAFTECADILVSYLYPWAGVVDTPFGSAWGLVKPRQTTRAHMHHEGETFFIVRGRGTLRVDGSPQEVEPGNVIFFPAFTTHTLTNDSEDEDLLFLTVWWNDPKLVAQQLGVEHERARKPRAVVFTAPLTPNGKVHLGHISGPYLGADVLTRYLRLRGVDALFTTWSDDYQQYVEAKAERDGTSPSEIARRFGDDFEESLAALGIHMAYCLRPQFSQTHATAVTDFTKGLWEAGHLVVKEAPTHYSEMLGRFLFEADVGGTCPHCGQPAGTGICEECGLPNDGVDLIDPVCYATGERPAVRPCRRLFFPLSRHAGVLRRFLEDARMSPRLRVLCESLLEGGLPDVPVSRHGSWGVPVPVPGLEDQVLVSWFEMAPVYLLTASEAARLQGWKVQGPTLLDWEDTEVVQLFGSDNGFVQAVLYPAVYEAWQPGGRRPSKFVMNEFYRLDGKKFSTSRSHAVWARDLLPVLPADSIRFYLCFTRPEREQTNFSHADLEATLRHELVDGWGAWLRQVGQRLEEGFGGTAPEPGYWTETHRDYLRDLRAIVARVAEAYEPESFSPRAVLRLLGEMVRRARELGTGEAPWARVARRRDEWRTAVALELATARALALMASPILPGFAAELWRSLGQETSLEENGWEEMPGWVPADARVALDRDFFPSLLPAPAARAEGEHG